MFRTSFLRNLCSFCSKQHVGLSRVVRKSYAGVSRPLCNFPANANDNKGTGDEESGPPIQVQPLIENSADFQEREDPANKWSTPVYPVMTEEQAKAQFEVRPTVDPRSTSIILFPGQGSQYVGMGKDLLDFPNVKEMYEAASEILGYDLLKLCLHGPVDMLNMTVHCQTAVMVTSLAAVEKLRHVCPSGIQDCVATAGFSVGEYTALVFAGALTFEDGVRLLRKRGEAMQRASDKVASGMMTVFLKPAAKLKFICAAAREFCKNSEIGAIDCRIAAYLFPDCRVISGNIEALKFIENNAADFGILKMKYIPVSGAFHSNLMAPAKKDLAFALNNVNFEIPLIPVHSNVDEKYYTKVSDIRKKLAAQLVSTVRWEQTMTRMFKRPIDSAFPSVYECGPGKSMQSMLKRINAKAGKSCVNIQA